MYAFQMDVDRPVEEYERVHAEVARVVGAAVPEHCLVHLATRTAHGFRVTEVWDSPEACQRFETDVMPGVISRVLGPGATVAGPPPRDDLEVLRIELGQRATASA